MDAMQATLAKTPSPAESDFKENRKFSMDSEDLKIADGSHFEDASTTSDVSTPLPAGKESAEIETQPFVPKSVNWHYTRKCNYTCAFCFHTAKNGFFLPSTEEGMAESKRCLKLLKDAGMEKLNFSGGEPFIHEKELGELVRFCKEDLALPSVSIVSNGSLIKQRWMKKWGKFVDILAISCDSFIEETNFRVGRGRGDHIHQLEKIKTWCEEYEVDFKINSVINAYNYMEDMRETIQRLNPKRWKVFQCLLINGENAGEEALRNAQPLTISEEKFQLFLDRHQDIPQMVPESNSAMVNSYLILDERLCFLNCTNGAKEPSDSILKVPVSEALRQAGFDEEMFVQRGGIYDWTKRPVDMEDLGGGMKKTKDLKVKATKRKEASQTEMGMRSFWFLAAAVGSLGLLAYLKGK